MLLSEKVIDWTRLQFKASGRTTAVIGISGGKDSAVVAAILAKAIGPDHVLGVMLPNGSQRDIEDSIQVITELGIRSMQVNISEPYQALCRAMGKTSQEAMVNIAPRLRMTALYAIAQSLAMDGERACVVGTGNRAERYVGYTTKWGDSACDLNPIQDLWVHEVLQVGDELGYFPNIVHKVPDDGLCGQTDEEKLGFSYEDVFHVAMGDAPVPDDVRSRIATRHAAARHKTEPIPYFPNV